MKQLLIILLPFFLAFANDLPVKKQDVSPQQLQKQNKQIIKLVVKELSKDLPKTIDKYTMFTNISAKNSNLIYIFEINTGAKSDEAVRKEDRSRMREAVSYGVCKSSKRFMDAQITIIYNYISAKSKANLFNFKINQALCYKLEGK